MGYFVLLCLLLPNFPNGQAHSTSFLSQILFQYKLPFVTISESYFYMWLDGLSFAMKAYDSYGLLGGKYQGKASGVTALYLLLYA